MVLNNHNLAYSLQKVNGFLKPFYVKFKKHKKWRFFHQKWHFFVFRPIGSQNSNRDIFPHFASRANSALESRNPTQALSLVFGSLFANSLSCLFGSSSNPFFRTALNKRTNTAFMIYHSLFLNRI